MPLVQQFSKGIKIVRGRNVYRNPTSKAIAVKGRPGKKSHISLERCLRVQMRFRVIVWMTVAAVVVAPLVGPDASRAGVEEEIAELRREVAEIKKQVGEIKNLLQGALKPQSPPKVTAAVGVSGRPSLGRQDAPVTLVKFSDYQCPFCKRHFSTVYPILKKDYIDTGKLRYVFRDFPIAGLHPQAQKAHEAAYCPGEQSKYWEMHDILFDNSQDLSIPALKRYATKIALNGDQFNACLESGKYAAR
jgi:protein-disulfide isomerase